MTSMGAPELQRYEIPFGLDMLEDWEATPKHNQQATEEQVARRRLRVTFPAGLGMDDIEAEYQPRTALERMVFERQVSCLNTRSVAEWVPLDPRSARLASDPRPLPPAEFDAWQRQVHKWLTDFWASCAPAYIFGRSPLVWHPLVVLVRDGLLDKHYAYFTVQAEERLYEQHWRLTHPEAIPEDTTAA